MNLALVFLCSIMASSSSVSMRTFQEKLQEEPRQLQVFQVWYMSVAAAAYLILSRLSVPQSPAAWLLALGFALCLAVSSIGTAGSLQCGPMSLSSIIISCNVILPILTGCLFYKERLSAVHIIGCLLLLATFILSGIGPKEEKKEVSPKWYVMVLMGFLGNGFGAVVLSAYSKLSDPGGNNGFLGVSFLLAAVLLFGYVMAGRKKGKKSTVYRRPLFFLLVAVSSVAVFGTNMLMLHLTGLFPTSVLYPLYNGVNSVLVCVVSCIAFKEPMGRKKLLTIALGIGAVVLLNL